MNRFKVFLLMSYFCMASVSVAMLTPALPMMTTSFAVSTAMIEWVVSIFLLGYALGQLIYGPLANRYGRLQALRKGLIVNIVGIVVSLIAVHASWYSLFLLGRFISAVGAASGLSCAIMLINALLSAPRAKSAMSYAIVSFTLGIGVATLAGGILSTYWSWQSCLYVLLIHGGVMLAASFILNDPGFQAKDIDWLVIIRQFLQALGHAQLLMLSLIVGFVSIFAYGFAAAAPIYTQQSLHLSALSYSYWNGFNMLGMLGSGFLSAYVMKRYGAKRLLITGMTGTAFSLMMFCFVVTQMSSSVLWFFIASLMMYLSSGLLFPAASYFASNCLNDKQSAASVMSFINMGSAFMCTLMLGSIPLTLMASFLLILLSVFIVIGLFSMRYLRSH